MRAEATAVAPADHLHGERQVHLLGQNIRQEEAVAFEKRDIGVVKVQLNLFVGGNRGHRAVEKVKIATDLFHYSVQAAGADKLHTGVKIAIDADLAFNKFSRCTNFQGVDLTKLTRMEIERTRGVAL